MAQNKDLTYTIGVDLGGTKIEAILHDGKKVVKSKRVSTEDTKGYSAVVDKIVELVQSIKNDNTVAVGIGTPGYVHEGIVRGTPNNPSLEGKPLAYDLHTKLVLPVFHENDAKLFALAEAKLGAGAGKKNVIGLIVGTGVGAGIVMDGHIIRGALGAAGEIGHAPYLHSDYEYYTAGKAVERMYRENGGKKEWGSKEILKKIFVDAPAKKVRLEHTEHLARLCATIINTFNPDVVVLGGGVSKSINYKTLRKATEKYAMQVPFKHAQIVPFKISDSAGAIGAAMLAREGADKAGEATLN